MTAAPDHEYSDQTDARRFALHIDGTLAAVIDYSQLGSAISFSRVFTSPPFRNRGLAGDLVAWAVDRVESETDWHIVPACWYVGEWFDRHPEKAHLLRPRTA